MVGVLDFIVANILALSMNYKFSMADSITKTAGVWPMAFTLIAISGASAAAAVAIVVYMSVSCGRRGGEHPSLGLAASGSGLSALVEFLNGVGTLGTEREAVRTGRALLRPRIVACKTVALIFSVFSGLVLGREGPAVHIGAGLGWSVAYFLFKSDADPDNIIDDANDVDDDETYDANDVNGDGDDSTAASSHGGGELGVCNRSGDGEDGRGITISIDSTHLEENDEERWGMKRVDSYALFKAGQNSPTRSRTIANTTVESVCSDDAGDGDALTLSPEVLEAAHEADLTHALVTAGGAAGFAAAFHAPCAAVLYMLEEVASPEKWKSKTTAQTFVSSAIAVVISTIMFNSIRGTNAALAYESIIIYAEGTTLEELKWRYGDILPFLLLSILSGGMMGLVTKYGLAISAQRSGSSWRKPPNRRILEAVLVAAVTALIFSTLPLSSGCVRDSHIDDDDDDGRDGASQRRRLTGASERLFVQYDCPNDQHNIMASLSLVGDENAITHLLARDSFQRFPEWLLAFFLCFYLPLFTLTLGLELPAGTFLPSLVSGAALGRLIGEALNEGGALESAGRGVSSPGVYALLGMAAALGGFTRCTVAVVVVVAEVAGDLSLILPSMVAVAVARSTASVVTSEGYTHMLIRVKRSRHCAPPPAALLSGQTCVCGNRTMKDSNFCRRCGRDLRVARRVVSQDPYPA